MKKIAAYIDSGMLFCFCLLFLTSPYSRHIPKIVFCVVSLLWTGSLVCRYGGNFYKYLIPHTGINIPLFLFLAAGVCSVVFSGDFYHSQSVFFERHIPFLILFWISAGFLKRNGDDEAGGACSFHRKIFFLSGAVLFSALFFGAGGVRDYILYRPPRLFTVFDMNINFGMFPLYLIYFIPFSYAVLLFSRKKILKIVPAAAVAVLGACWIVQGSRMAWVAIPLSLFYIAWVTGSKKQLFSLLSVLLILFVFFPQGNKARIKKVLTSYEWRVPREVWGVAAGIFLEHPVTGAGIGMYERLVLEYGEKLHCHIREGRKYLHAHSVYMETAAEMGMLGLFSFLSIFAVFFWRSFKTAGRINEDVLPFFLGTSGAVCATLFLGIWGSIITVGVQGGTLFWTLLGFCVGVQENPRSRGPERAEGAVPETGS